MKNIYRLLNIILLAVLMIITLVLAAFSFGLTGTELLQNIEADLYQNPLTGIIFLLVFLLTAWVLYPLFKPSQQTTILSSDEHGAIKITHAALDKMIRSILKNEEGLKVKSTALSSKEAGMEVKLKIAVEEDQDIPHLTERIKNNIRFRLKEITGAEIEQVQILIENISPRQRGDKLSKEPTKVAQKSKRSEEKDTREIDSEFKKAPKDEKAEEDKDLEKEDEKDSRGTMNKIFDKLKKKEEKNNTQESKIDDAEGDQSEDDQKDPKKKNEDTAEDS